VTEVAFQDAFGAVLRLGWSWTEGHADLVLREVPKVVLAEAAEETPEALADRVRTWESRGNEPVGARLSELIHALFSSPWVRASIDPAAGDHVTESVDVRWRADWWRLRAPEHEQRVCFRADGDTCPAKPPGRIASCGPCAIYLDKARTDRERASRPEACCYAVSSPPPPKAWKAR
jgi:hypothetical protein